MKKGSRKVLAVVLVLAVVISIASIGMTASSGVDHRKTYRINVFTMLGNTAGLQTGWSAKILKDKFNLEMNMIASNLEGGGDAKFATMMASGNLGDIVILGSDSDGKYTDAIKVGFLLDWTKNGRLNKYAPYIVKNFGKV
ncbi:MAG TPA: ABC transporter substrate-binding protein, partial [Bacillota bacterium]